ncbi:5,6-dimethylbenzimidazole synthase [Halarcobacter ebronensis]|uniref:5,6-dimethylbenzimidazole synthase n=1 Tax=Halarcobacter ebronensis TaxID=1462615 RepID=A0A4Q1AK62_9BACT|nr:5,6-dimethylbenzimidazole synthase [Halarcobacter ebronensis]QKF82148.1 5,6-dimethylbenzimidazole synthase [Halarcobacter ebronensis]RXK03473.1 5,6-dimethylbenzimidazole synthase [Halarcobacter ebronensis]
MKEFTKEDIETLKQIMLLRRDVRGNRFNNKKIDDEILDEILNAANMAPSVGFSQPWKFLLVKSKSKREEIYEEFIKENEKAKKIFKDKELYASLKLEGIKESYINIAVLYEKPKKSILGQTTQKKMGEYSVVCAIENLWLMARAFNIGVGWISILKPKNVKKILGIGSEHKLIAYLALGYVDEFLEEPELLKIKWEDKKSLKDIKII